VGNFRKPWVNEFVWSCSAPHLLVKTDQRKGFIDLPRLGHTHQTIPLSMDKKQACKMLPDGHLLISNIRQFILGRHHAVRGKHAQRYLGEFNFQSNRDNQESTPFATLIRACVRA